jgi:hypothetical protein
MSKIDEINQNYKNKKPLKPQLISQNIRCLICKKRIKNYKNIKNKILFDKKENINGKDNETNKKIDNTKESINKEEEKVNPNFINIFCNKCNDKEAIFECLNCDLILCFDCKSNHQLDPIFQTHKIISYELNPNITFSQCPFHKLNYKYFCLDDNAPLCFKCTESLHQNHNIKLIKEINDYYLENIEKEIKKGNNNINNLKELINSLNELKIKLEKEKNIIIRKLLKNFKDINNIIVAQKNVINNQINVFFNKKIELIDKKITNLNLIQKRFYYYKNYLMVNKITFFDNIKDKLNKIQLYKNIKYMNRLIFNKINYDYFYQKIKLTSYSTYSLFINEPMKKISEIIKKYNFIPLPINILDHYKKIFKYSNIISPDLITTDLLLVLPKIISLKLLYRVSHLGPSAELFHQLCDNKGPTLMFIKTSTGHIFGSFNSLYFKSISKYELSYDNFLFSISDGRLRRPMRCKIIKQLAEYALKQATNEYSPGFGISNDADLFIAFKKLNNSYSHLGKVYKCPKGYNPKTFLAGKENQWDILDIEIYSINYISDNDFFHLYI